MPAEFGGQDMDERILRQIEPGVQILVRHKKIFHVRGKQFNRKMYLKYQEPRREPSEKL